MSRLYGAVIDDVDTYEKWGLILLADLKIGAPSFEGKFIKIPGRNGMINASYGVSDGEPVYGNRNITFTLFTNKDETAFNEIVSELINYCHGREKSSFCRMISLIITKVFLSWVIRKAIKREQSLSR